MHLIVKIVQYTLTSYAMSQQCTQNRQHERAQNKYHWQYLLHYLRLHNACNNHWKVKDIINQTNRCLVCFIISFIPSTKLQYFDLYWLTMIALSVCNWHSWITDHLRPSTPYLKSIFLTSIIFGNYQKYIVII